MLTSLLTSREVLKVTSLIENRHKVIKYPRIV